MLAFRVGLPGCYPQEIALEEVNRDRGISSFGELAVKAQVSGGLVNFDLELLVRVHFELLASLEGLEHIGAGQLGMN